ncbi:MAG: hypothetical protein A2Y76_06730 [Planctomycetes bacterium RBG_13_60_9]|nr:MAG: hypothetical protein A2Y76_06730 [Planctomycetes bacterium RBG_13_60_9]
MRTRNGFLLAVTITSVTFLLLGIGTLSAKPDKPDPHRPIPASDVVLVQKMSAQGKRPANAGGGTSKRFSATGVLGTECHGNRYAIVIGISDYPGLWNDLDFADDDAALMTEILRESYGFGYDRIITLVNADATRPSILDAIETVRGLTGPADEVVFFYSGHGANGAAEDGDKEKTDEAIVVNPPRGVMAPYELLWDGELASAFSDFDTSRIIFIFDSCMAGGMDDLEGPGRVILMASPERGYAWEGEEWAYGDNDGNGEFTYYLARGILDGEARIYNYYGTSLSWIEPVTVEAAFDYARANCDQDNPVIVDDFPYDLLP